MRPAAARDRYKAVNPTTGPEYTEVVEKATGVADAPSA
jgi:hypothetical protein